MSILRQCQRSTILLLQKHFENYKKISTSGPEQKHWLGFSNITSEDSELYQDLDET